MRPSAVAAVAIFALGLVGGQAQGAEAAEPSGLHLVQSAIGLGAAADGSPVEAATFYTGENVKFYTKLRFDSSHQPGEKHHLVYKWYTGDVVSQSFEAQKQFDVSPTDWWAYISVSHLSPGPHRAELYIDDQLFASGAFSISAAKRPYEPEEDTAIKTASLALLLAGDTQHFDELAARYRTSHERTSSGTWKLSLLYNAVDEHSFDPADPHWKELHDTSDTWLASQPDSPTAVAINARILFAHAWAWRGNSAGNAVPPQNQAMYEEMIERARSVLDTHPRVAQQDPEWDTLRISIARQQGADSEEILAMADRALERWPSFYAIHNAAINALLPRWGGSRKDIQTYTKLAMEHSRALEGTQAYARIYYYIARTAQRDALDELNRSGGDFPPFKQSIDEILQKYPTSFNRDIARNMAYLAGDAAAYRSYGRATTNGLIPIAWWDTRAWRQWANEWAFEGKRGTTFDPVRRVRAYLSFLRQGPEFWNPLRWTIVIGILLIEAGFQLADWLVRRSARAAALMRPRAGTFNPFDYPRTYPFMPLGRTSIRVGLWLFMFSAASAYLLSTIPWPDPEETTLVMAGLIAVAAVSVLTVVNVLTARIVLRTDELLLKRLVGSRTIRRSDILGVRCHTPTAELRIFEVVPRADGAKPLLILPLLGEDDAFRLWFESLPALAVEEQENEDEQAEQSL